MGREACVREVAHQWQLVQWIRNRGPPRPLLVTSAKKKGTPVESGAVDLSFEDKALPARSCVAKKRRGTARHWQLVQ